jgi:hypothetical protein
MGNNNRWAREGGVIDEILVENMYRNPEGNAIIYDTILLEKVLAEPNIRLLLNTAVFETQKSDPQTISAVRAFCSQNSTMYELVALLFCDASGDGIVAFQSGAAFRMGAESKEEFGEKFAPTAEYGELLGHSLYFYSKDTGKPVRFVPPAYALQDITRIPRYRRFNAKEHGCQLWWIEYGGRLDTVHDTEKIKWELWKVVYGVWNHIKNSGNFPEAETMTLEWVGYIPGKRESRRFEGDYILKQQDIVEQREHYDAVAFGGWSIDLHPADGVFSEKPGCNQWHSKGLYQIPYRSLYSRNLNNLLLAGRIISVSHVAFGSSRVMGTSAYVGQAAGMAAAVCTNEKISPKTLSQENYIGRLQQELLKTGQHIPNFALADESDIVRQASLSASTELTLRELPADGPFLPLQHPSAQMLPVAPGEMPKLTLRVEAKQNTELVVELRRSSKPRNHTPDVTLETQRIPLHAGLQPVTLSFTSTITEPQYVFVCLMQNEHVRVQHSQLRVTGILSVFNHSNPAVSNYGKQEPTEEIGVDAFEFWTPKRRPEGLNLAMQISPGIRPFGPENLRNGIHRPVSQPNAWVADPGDKDPTVTMSWPEKKRISRVEMTFDTDWDHPMETVLMTHPESVMPFCVKEYYLCDDHNRKIHHRNDNHQTRNTVIFDTPVETNRLTIHLKGSHGGTPASLFEVRCYGE